MTLENGLFDENDELNDYGTEDMENRLDPMMPPEEEIFFEERRQRTFFITFFLIMVLLLGAAQLADSGRFGKTVPAYPSVEALPSEKITLPNYTEDVLLCSKAAKQEYDREISLKAAVKTGSPYRPFRFEYALVNCSGSLLIGEKENLSDAREYALPETERYIEIDNLKVDTTYYYKVIVNKQEFDGNFHTADSTRFVNIPGLVNTRDIGGGTTLDGRKVKQGLLIRGVELDGLVNVSHFIPKDELENVQDCFGFVYDLDLRGSNIYVGRYVSRLSVPHHFYGAPMYGEIFSQNYQISMKRIFNALSDPKKYPMYLHCTLGQDRTGTIIFLLQGILNMSESDMKREYLLTGYTNPSLLESDNMDVIISGLETYEGDTLQEKITTFLITEIGVTESEIASIRSIFLEK